MMRPCFATPTASTRLYQIRRHVREFALVQLRLPEDGVRVVEAMLHPAVLFDMVQVDEATRVRVTVSGGEDTPPAELEGVFIREVVLVVRVEHTVGEGLTGTDTEEVTSKTSAVAINVVKGGAFLRGYACAHGTLISG